jgi:hypothetical protein
LASAWSINGVSSAPTRATPLTAQIFLVKKWAFGTPTVSTDPPYNYEFLLNANGSMVGVANFGDIANQAGIAGQGLTTPAEKAFILHCIQKYNGVYYDPSYGVTYANDADFQTNAVAGYGIKDPVQDVPGRIKFDVKQVIPNSIEIQLSN